MELASTLLVVFAFLAAGAAVVTAVLAASSTPSRVVKGLADCQAAVAELGGEVAAIRAAWLKYRS